MFGGGGGSAVLWVRGRHHTVVVTMFKKFDGGSDVTGFNQAKSSVVRGIRASVAEQYPTAAEKGWLEQIMPKKDPVQILKCRDHIELIVVKGELVFFKQRDGPYIPTLKLLHKYPNILPKVQVDKGAIRFILSGANVMCPGLTSPGARMDTQLPTNTIVAVMAEGKQLAVCIGLTKLSTQEITTINKGVGIESIHYLGDGLWRMKEHI